MRTDFLTSSPPKTRVLFMAWGFSIHAKRRIQLFVDDPSFEVAVVSTFNYNFSGAKNYLLSNAQEGLKDNFLRKLVKVILRLLARIARKSFYLFGRNIDLLDEEVLLAFQHYRQLRAIVKEFSPKVIFLQTLLYPCYISFFLPPSIPIIITFWNGDVLWWAKWNGIERSFKKQITKYAVKRASAMTVNSETAFNACLDYGSHSDKVHIIRYPGVDTNLFKTIPKQEARNKLGILAPKIVLSPRGLGGYLNSDIILESAIKVVEQFPDTLFVFLSGVGSHELPKYQTMVQQLGIEQNFLWVGQINHEDMALYYAASDVMVSISSNDSLPNVMLEAMACGTPIIMGDIPQIREWVEDGVNGYLVAPRDAETLSKKIQDILINKDGIVEEFTSRNREIVSNQLNSELNIKLVKTLVTNVARGKCS